MLAFLTQSETFLRRLSDKFAAICFVLAAFLLLTLAADVHAGLLQSLPPRGVKSAAKGFGQTAVLFSLLTLSYYVLKEMWLKKSKDPQFKASVLAQYIPKTLSCLRLLHPLAGMLALSFAAVHAYIFLSLWLASLKLSALYSGLIAIASLLIVASLGVTLRRKPTIRHWRLSHKYIAWGFALLFVIHKTLA